MSRRKPEETEEVTEVKKEVACSNCQRTVAQLQDKGIKLMMHHKKPLIAFCVSCKTTWPENAKACKGQLDEEED